jgi:hypothetical protein
MSVAFVPFFIAMLVGAPLLNGLAQQDTSPTVFSPQPGQALQGSVPINGNTAVEGFQSAELSFSYAGDARDTWFIIQEMDAPVSNGALADWDTTTLTDGEYTLRLVVRTDRGEPLVVTVSGLRVRNYTPVETATPPPRPSPVPGVAAAPTAAPTSTPTSTPAPLQPSGAPLPPNPAEISPAQISGSLAKGALAALGVFILLAGYHGLRQLLRWRRARG